MPLHGHSGSKKKASRSYTGWELRSFVVVCSRLHKQIREGWRGFQNHVRRYLCARSREMGGIQEQECLQSILSNTYEQQCGDKKARIQLASLPITGEMLCSIRMKLEEPAQQQHAGDLPYAGVTSHAAPTGAADDASAAPGAEHWVQLLLPPPPQLEQAVQTERRRWQRRRRQAALSGSGCAADMDGCGGPGAGALAKAPADCAASARAVTVSKRCYYYWQKRSTQPLSCCCGGSEGVE